MENWRPEKPHQSGYKEALQQQQLQSSWKPKVKISFPDWLNDWYPQRGKKRFSTKKQKVDRKAVEKGAEENDFKVHTHFGDLIFRCLRPLPAIRVRFSQECEKRAGEMGKRRSNPCLTASIPLRVRNLTYAVGSFYSFGLSSPNIIIIIYYWLLMPMGLLYSLASDHYVQSICLRMERSISFTLTTTLSFRKVALDVGDKQQTGLQQTTLPFGSESIGFRFSSLKSPTNFLSVLEKTSSSQPTTSPSLSGFNFVWVWIGVFSPLFSALPLKTQLVSNWEFSIPSGMKGKKVPQHTDVWLDGWVFYAFLYRIGRIFNSFGTAKQHRGDRCVLEFLPIFSSARYPLDFFSVRASVRNGPGFHIPLVANLPAS